MGHLAFLRLYYHNMTQELKVLFKTFIIKTVESDLEKSPLGQFGYLHSLNIYYERWISKLNKDKVMIINTDNFNIFKDVDQFKQIVCKIRNSINE